MHLSEIFVFDPLDSFVVVSDSSIQLSHRTSCAESAVTSQCSTFSSEVTSDN